MSSSPEIRRLIKCIEFLNETFSPRLTLDNLALFLLIAEKSPYPMIDLASRYDNDTSRTSKKVNALADQRYGGGTYKEGYRVIYTAENQENRAYKDAYLSEKGAEIKNKLISILKSSK